MKRSQRFLIPFLCFTLLCICILSSLPIHAVTVKDSLASTVDEINAISPSMNDLAYGGKLKQILDDRRVQHYGQKDVDLTLLNTVRSEIAPFVSELDTLIIHLPSNSNDPQKKTDLLGLSLKGLYTGTLAWIYHSNVDDSIKDVFLTVPVEFGSTYQVTTTEMSVGDYYAYLRDDGIKGKPNGYFAKNSPDVAYRYFTWMLQAIYEARLSLLAPDESLSEAHQNNIRDVLGQANTDVKSFSYLPGVPTEAADGTVLTDGEDALNFQQVYQKATLLTDFADIYALLCPDRKFSESSATESLIASLSDADQNSEINQLLRTSLDNVLSELQGNNTSDNAYTFAYFQSLREDSAAVFDTANGQKSLVDRVALLNVFDDYGLKLTQTNAKDELFEALNECLKNTDRYPADSEEKANLEAMASSAITAIDGCVTQDEMILKLTQGMAEITLYDEYLYATEKSEMPYLSNTEIKEIQDGLTTLYDTANTTIESAEALSDVENALTENRTATNDLLREASKDNLTRKAEAIHDTVEEYEYLDTATKEDFFALLDEALADALTSLSSSPDLSSSLQLEKEASDRLEQIDRDAAKEEYQKALDHVKSKKEEYSQEQYDKITDIVDQANNNLSASPSREEYLDTKDQVLERVEELPNRLDETFLALEQNKNDYTEEDWNRLQSIYTEAKQALNTPSALPDGMTAATFIQSMIREMQKIPLQTVYTADKQLATDQPSDYREGDGYYGSVSCTDGLPSNAQLVIGRIGKDSHDAIAKRIMQAAKDGRITDKNGASLPKDLNRLLKDCRVSFGFDASLTPKENGKTYTLSVLLPKGTSLSHVIGIVLLNEDGSAEYYEMTSEDLKITFETDRFATYYVVNANVVNLLPVIIILAIILLAEIVILAMMYVRRSRRKKSAIPLSAMALVPPYFPENGWITVIILSIAIVVLGGWIASIPILEKLAARKASRPVPEETPEEEEKEEIIEEPTPSTPELPEAEPILALPKKEHVESLPEADPTLALPASEEIPSLPEREPIPTLPKKMPLLSLPFAARPVEPVYIDLEQYTGNRKGEINLDTLSAHFEEGDRITLNDLKRKKLIPRQVGAVKILGRGQLGKSLIIFAQDFSEDAREKIEADGGVAIVTHSSPKIRKM